MHEENAMLSLQKLNNVVAPNSPKNYNTVIQFCRTRFLISIYRHNISPNIDLMK